MVESVAVTVSGGGTTAGPGSSHRDSELIAPHSLSGLLQSISPLLSQSLHVHHTNLLVSCPPLHAHVPYCILLLSGPGSDSIFRVRAPGSDYFSRAPAPNVLPQSLEPRLRLLKTHAPFPPSPHFCILPLIEYSSLQFHSIYNRTTYHQCNSNVLTLRFTELL